MAPAPAAQVPPAAAPAPAPQARPAAAAPPAPQAAPAAPAPAGFRFEQVVAGQMLIETLLAKPAHADPRRLERYGWKGYSQTDEDGILQEIFRRIGIAQRSFVELGCGFGMENNTAYLLSQGWRGLWVDGADENALRIRRAFRYLIEQRLLQFEQAMITRENVDALVAAAALGPEIDLLSIDLDGNDYYVWEAITCVNPRVVVIEYNAKFHPPHDWCMAYNAAHTWADTDQMGCSLEALARLGAARGYVLAGCNLVGANAFFVRRDLAGEHFATPASAAHLFQPARYYLTTAFYAGHLANSLTIVEGASLGAGLPWPPQEPVDAMYFEAHG